MSQTHHLKIDSKMFTSLLNGKKNYEIRYNDRNYKVGDFLILKETLHTGEKMKEGRPLVYTGQEYMAKVKHILKGPVYGLMNGWVILSI